MSVVRGVHEFPIHPPTNGQAADAPDVFPLQWFRDIKPVLSAGDFVRGVLVGGTAAVIYGASNSGKTFFVTDLALHVAAGFQWFGRRVEQGGVI